ncbi:MAG TPA: ATP-dependent DNA ligase, partial [Nevskiaceae bacterium]|nr:ATP-dependent DNA ligase [Nevskiaceae bacterium]
MKRFARLYAELDATTATSRKVDAMRRYFADAPPADAAWGLYFLLGHRLKRVIAPSKLRAWLVELSQLPPGVIEEGRAHVGDFAETAALVLDTLGLRDPTIAETSDRPLHRVAADLLRIAEADESVQHEQVVDAWRRLPFLECFLYTKLLTGALRVGVSAGLAMRAFAEHAGLDAHLVQARLMGDWMPGEGAYAALLEPGTVERIASQPYPFCLAHPHEGDPTALGPPEDFLVEWKWDGIRAQVIRREGKTWIWSRGEELLEGRFPEVEDAAVHLPDGCVLDGEILAWREGVLPFAVLQRRIGRKTLSKKMLAEAPVAFLAYDLLEVDGLDRRGEPLHARRRMLEVLLSATSIAAQPAIHLSEPVPDATWDARTALRETARERGVEGFMLKRLDSAYVGGRKRGVWWKWKIGAMTVDTVLVYAQPGSGRRSNL